MKHKESYLLETIIGILVIVMIAFISYTTIAANRAKNKVKNAQTIEELEEACDWYKTQRYIARPVQCLIEIKGYN